MAKVEKAAPKAPRQAIRRTMVYPPELARRDPMIVLLRHGVANMLGKTSRMLDAVAPGKTSLYQRMMDAAETQPFVLSPGAALLQHMFGPESGAGTFRMQTELRGVLVAMTVLERCGRDALGEVTET